MTGRVLVVAGSDSGAGAGIQADLKTVAALGGYATTAITALTAQNTLGVEGVLKVPPDFVARQMAAVLDDIGADCIKTGMLVDAATIAAVAEIIEEKAPAVPLVIDPVMVSTSGTRLLDEPGTDALMRRLVPRAALLTPNLPEAAALTGQEIRDRAGMRRAAGQLAGLGARAILVKGGHLEGSDMLYDLLWDRGTVTEIEAPRIASRHTHGTGCTLASAIAVGLAQGLALLDAVRRARAYLGDAIRNAPGLGQGNGPLGHMHTLRNLSE